MAVSDLAAVQGRPIITASDQIKNGRINDDAFLDLGIGARRTPRHMPFHYYDEGSRHVATKHT